MGLVEHTLFGVVDKVQIAIDRIRQFEPPEGYYVAFSGGKDSCVVKDLVKRSGVKADYHYNLTTVDPPELVYFIREHHKDVEVHKPKYTMWQLIDRKSGPPTRLIRFCCDWLKERGGEGRTVVTGVRREESFGRSERPVYTPWYSGKRTRKIIKYVLNPIVDWTILDIWNYINDNKIPYCSLYDEGWDRIGCVMCPMAGPVKQKMDAERWPKIADAYRRACGKAFQRKLNNGKQMEWQSGDDMYEWWISGKASDKRDPDQTVMFE
jgi:phosphoadenosine phosphosulfate reductase